MKDVKGFAALPLLVVTLAVFAVVGGGIYLYSNFQSSPSDIPASSAPLVTVEPTSSPSPSPSPTASPTAKPTVTPTKKPTPVATVKPVVTPQPTQAGGGCPSGNEKGDLVVNIQKLEGTIPGDTTVTLSCAGVGQKTQVIPQGGRSVTFYGYSVGKYHVKVSNSGTNYESDVDIKTGGPPITFNFPYE